MEEINLFEVWKPIPGFENYEVSSEGRVRSIGRWENTKHGGMRFRKGRILKQVDRGNGYQCVGIFNEEGHRLVNIHRLVAEVFLPNPDNLPQVNHKDECKSNNSVENLEWCSVEYNLTYGNHNKNIVTKQISSGRYNPKYSTTVTGLSYKEIKHIWYEDHKEDQLLKSKIRYQNKRNKK